jgi:hypothetical protein
MPATTPRPALAGRRVYAGYLAAQAALGVIWWITLATSGTVRSWFELMPGNHAVMDAFVFADVGVVVVGSAVSAWAIERDAPWAVPAVAFTAGGIVYPTLYLVGWVGFTGEGSPLLAAMLATSTLTVWIAYQVWRARRAVVGG